MENYRSTLTGYHVRAVEEEKGLYWGEITIEAPPRHVLSTGE
jgi:hypothetical protein